MTNNGRRRGGDPETEAHGLHIVRLHQALEDWRAVRRLARMHGWSPIAAALIEIEITTLEREIAERVRELF